MNLDKKLPADVAAVLDAASMLDITEYELFQLAWTRWHGRPAQASELEACFVSYMFDQEVPAWVRHFAREVEGDRNAKRLDKESLGITALTGSKTLVRKGVRYAVLLIVVLTLLISLAQFSAKLTAIADRCVFPPCY